MINTDFFTVDSSLVPSTCTLIGYNLKSYDLVNSACASGYSGSYAIGTSADNYAVSIDITGPTFEYTLQFCYTGQLSSNSDGTTEDFVQVITLSVTPIWCSLDPIASFSLEKIPFNSNSSPVAVITGFAELFNYNATATCSRTCTLHDSGCSVYTGSKLTLTSAGQMSAVQNDPPGYSETVCVKCVYNSYEYTNDGIVVTQDLFDCSTDITPLNAVFNFDYEGVTGSSVIISAQTNVFSFQYASTCGSSCTYSQPCSSALASTHVTASGD